MYCTVPRGLTSKAVFTPKIALGSETSRGCVATGTAEKMKYDPGDLVWGVHP